MRLLLKDKNGKFNQIKEVESVAQAMQFLRAEHNDRKSICWNGDDRQSMYFEYKDEGKIYWLKYYPIEEEATMPQTYTFTNSTKMKIPLMYQDMLTEVYHDSDGYWAYTRTGFMSPTTECHTIHEMTQKELIKEIRMIEPCYCDVCKSEKGDN